MIRSQTVQIAGKRLVLLEQHDYDQLCRLAGLPAVDDDDLPPLPEPDEHGNFPAIEYGRIALARDLIRQRKAAGLSQQQLADLARVRQETISRLEGGKHTASPRTIDRIDRALKAAVGHLKGARQGKSKKA